ncbi:MAG: hypothetical protein ACOZAO_03730 [Patescibacteria group bacterium]
MLVDQEAQLRAIALFNEAIEGLGSSGQASLSSKISSQAGRLGLRVGDSAIPMGMRLHPITATQQRWATQNAEGVFMALTQVEAAALGRNFFVKWLVDRSIPSARDRALFFQVSKRKREGKNRYQMARLDLISRAVEVNGNGVQGWAFHDKAAELYETVLPDFFPGFRGLSLPRVAPRLLSLILSAYKVERGNGVAPTIGIVKLRGRDEVEKNEAPYIAKQFRMQGTNTIIGYADQVSLRDNEMYLRGKRIHVIYRVFDVANLGDLWDDAKDLYEIFMRPDDFTVVPSVSDSIVGLKFGFALLSSPIWRTLLVDSKYHDAINELVPWTRMVTPFNPMSIVLPIAMQWNYVLKTSYGSSGNEVHMGRKTFPLLWWMHMLKSLVTHDSVVQKMDTHGGYDWPIYHDGEFGIQRRITDVNPHIFGGTAPGTAIVRFGSPKGHPINVGNSDPRQRGGVSLPVSSGTVIRALRS